MKASACWYHRALSPPAHLAVMTHGVDVGGMLMALGRSPQEGGQNFTCRLHYDDGMLMVRLRRRGTTIVRRRCRGGGEIILHAARQNA